MDNTITIVTGNKNKLKEIISIFGNDIPITNEKIDLIEIQSLDIKEICEHKVKEAYKLLQKPVVVEDTSAYLDELNGLPGPFIKFFEEQLGVGALITLANSCKSRETTIVNNLAYYDGKNLIQTQGITKGTISNEIKEGEGFGFDFCFTPSGYNKTLSELGLEKKQEIYGRKKAIENLKEELKNKNLI